MKTWQGTSSLDGGSSMENLEGGLAARLQFPLVVDLDGTLTPTDTLLEGIIRLAKHYPIQLLRLPYELSRGRASFKAWVCSHGDWSAEHLPLNEALVDYLRAEHCSGREILLATAADSNIAHQVAQRLGIFSRVICSDGITNLKGRRKLEAIRQGVGGRFVYAGDSPADMPIWREAEAAILVGTSGFLSRKVRNVVPVEKEWAAPVASAKTWLRALRVHQWLKNLLLFVPLLTSFGESGPASFIAVIQGFFAFSLVASATYLGNDLWDLDADRQHPRKRNRPLASGSIRIAVAIPVALVLLAVGFLLAGLVGPSFQGVLLLYLVTTTVYSLRLKRYVLADVFTLSVLYTMRIIAGSVAAGVLTSSWLLAFAGFIFLSLALIKRCAELMLLLGAGKLASRGRDYRVSDLTILWPLGIGAGLSSVVVFGLFINTPDVQARYASPGLLWLVALGLTYWITRLWIKTARGEMDDDPLVFALKDFGSRATIAGMLVVTLVAHFIPIG